jgi:hypothetical protein
LLCFSVSAEVGRDQSLAPINSGSLSLQFGAPVTGMLERNRFLETTSGVVPTNQDQSALRLTPEP